MKTEALDKPVRTSNDLTRNDEFEGFPQTASYRPTKIVGQGYWGTVYAAEDLRSKNPDGSYQSVAIKVLDPTEVAYAQMTKRALTFDDAVGKETPGFKATRHVLPRILEWSDDDIPFIVMPLCEQSLEAKLRNSALSEKEKYRLAHDVAAGIEEMHTVYGRAHGDIKFSNYVVDRFGRPFLTDFGTSTLVSYRAQSASARDNMGEAQTRAPELFKTGSHPTKRSDVFAGAALAYKLFTGKYPFENEYKRAGSAGTFFATHTDKEIKKLVKNKARAIPAPFRKLIRKGLSSDEYRRQDTGEELRKDIDRAIYESEPRGQVSTLLKNTALRVGLPLALGVLGYGFGVSQYSWQKDEPLKVALRGPLYSPVGPDEPHYQFDIEDIQGLPKPGRGGMFDSSTIDSLAKRVSDNKTIAWLTSQDVKARLNNRGWGARITDYQIDLFISSKKLPVGFTKKQREDLKTDGDIYAFTARGVAEGLKLAQKSPGVVDLEDVLVIARLGPEVLQQAQHAANSFHFKEYLSAKDAQGKPIIPVDEQDHLRKWLAWARGD